MKLTLPATLPDVLRIVDGELVCVDGRHLQTYLREFTASHGIKKNRALILVCRDQLAEVLAEVRHGRAA